VRRPEGAVRLRLVSPAGTKLCVSLYSVRRSCVVPYGCIAPGVPPPAARAPSGPTSRRATGCRLRRWGSSRSAEGWALWASDRWSNLLIATGGTCQLGKQAAEPPGWASSWGSQAMCRTRARARPLRRRGSGEFRRGKRMGPALRVAFSRPLRGVPRALGPATL
jgi:hypothetical protein